MLLRAALLVEDLTLSARVLQLLRKLSVWSEPLDVGQLHNAAQTYDLIFTGPHLSTQQVLEALQTVAQGEDPPAIVRLYETSDPTGQALLLGEGLADSIYIHLDDEWMSSALQTITDRRGAEIASKLGKTGDEPRLRDFRSLCPAMQAFRIMAKTVAHTHSTVLILGETGVGKEWLAHAIHSESPRREGPFVPINCGALNETLLESELFGHVRGAFTGAEASRRGHFELAHGGTLFLDEIGEMPMHLQSRLLRVLEDRKVQRLGSEKSVRVDVRIIAATHRNLVEDVSARRFRADLLYRLRVVQLHIPPLRERQEDIPSLARYHAIAAAKRIGLQPVELSCEALDYLRGYTWPGNVRELANVIERAVILNRGVPIQAKDLPEEVRFGHSIPLSTPLQPTTPTYSIDAQDIPDELFQKPWREVREYVIQAAEKTYLTHLLNQTQGRVGEAARRAGLSERGLFEKMRRHGLSKNNFRKHRPKPTSGSGPV